jgi:uncharacterized protein (DUF58 family)
MSQHKSSQYTDPETLEAIGDLKISAEVIAQGFLKGLHRSPHRGGSVEFSEYRQYQPGDDIRHIDWKLFGCRDEYYIKRFENQTNLTAYLVVDTSESMSYRSSRASWSKFDFAAHLGATLTYILLQQGDQIGLSTFSTEDKIDFLPAASSWSQLDRICESLEAIDVQGSTEVNESLNVIGEKIGSNAVVLLISDLLGIDEETFRLLGAMRQRGADISVFHPLDPDEIELPFEGETRFKPLESDGKLDVEAGSVRADYRRKLQGFLESNESRFRQSGIDYQWFSTLDSVEQVCRKFLGGQR